MTESGLLHQLLAYRQPVDRTYSFEETHRHIMKNVRRYDVASLAQHVLAALQAANKPTLEGQGKLPWIPPLILKWALLDSKVRLGGGEPMPAKVFHSLIHRLWNSDQVLNADGNLQLMMRRLIYQQIMFQTAETKHMLLWPTLIARTDRGSNLRSRFRDAMGMEPEDFLDLSTTLYAGLLKGQGRIAPQYFQLMRPAYGDKVDKILGIFSRNLAQLRADLQADPKEQRRHRNELMEFPFIERYPLVQFDNGQIGWWHPRVFSRGLETAVHQRLAKFQQAYSDPFSRLFEDWVTELAVGTGVPCVTEAQYKSRLGHGSRAVEAILRPGACTVLVESKMSMFPDAVMLTDSEVAVRDKLERVRAAIVQAADVALALQDPANPFHDPQATPTYALVVTSRELLLGSAQRVQELFPKHPIEFTSSAASQALPLGNIFVVSPKEFDRVIGVARAGRLDLQAVLEDAVAKEASPVSRRMFMSEYYGHQVGKFDPPPAEHAAMIELHRRIANNLGIPIEDLVSAESARVIKGEA